MNYSNMVIGTTYLVKYYPHKDFDRLHFVGMKWGKLFSFRTWLGNTVNFLEKDIIEAMEC